MIPERVVVRPSGCWRWGSKGVESFVLWFMPGPKELQVVVVRLRLRLPLSRLSNMALNAGMDDTLGEEQCILYARSLDDLLDDDLFIYYFARFEPNLQLVSDFIGKTDYEG